MRVCQYSIDLSALDSQPKCPYAEVLETGSCIFRRVDVSLHGFHGQDRGVGVGTGGKLIGFGSRRTRHIPNFLVRASSASWFRLPAPIVWVCGWSRADVDVQRCYWNGKLWWWLPSR